MSKDKQVFYSVRTFISQQSPKLTLTGSNMGLVLTIRANLITKTSLMSFDIAGQQDFYCNFLI